MRILRAEVWAKLPLLERYSLYSLLQIFLFLINVGVLGCEGRLHHRQVFSVDALQLLLAALIHIRNTLINSFDRHVEQVPHIRKEGAGPILTQLKLNVSEIFVRSFLVVKFLHSLVEHPKLLLKRIQLYLGAN